MYYFVERSDYLKPTDHDAIMSSHAIAGGFHVTVLAGHVESLASEMQSFPYIISCR